MFHLKMISVWIKPDSSDICILKSKYGITFVASFCSKKKHKLHKKDTPLKK